MPEGVEGTLHVPVSAPLRIVVDYWNSVPGAVLNVSLLLNFNGDSCAFNTTSKAVAHERGYHRATCHIPGGLLNDETYSVRLLLLQDESRVLVNLDRAVSFELHDVQRDGAWFGKWEGAVRPSLPWSTQYSGADAPAPG